MNQGTFANFPRLRELHARNNRFGTLLELAVYTRQLRRLIVLDLRANPLCSTPGYRDVVLNTYPALLNLDSKQVDPVEHVRCYFVFDFLLASASAEKRFV